MIWLNWPGSIKQQQQKYKFFSGTVSFNQAERINVL